MFSRGYGMVDQTGGAFLLGTLGCFLSAAGGQPLVNYISGDKTLKTPLPAILAVLGGVILIFMAVFWRPSTGSGAALMQTLAQWGSNPAPYVIILLLLWGHLQTLAIRRNIELATLRNDQHSMTEVLNRFALPRQLSETQSNSIAQFLKSFPSQDVGIEVVQGDEEAISYGIDLQNALKRGGWNVKSLDFISPPKVIQSGLSIDFIQTPENNQIQATTNNPKVNLLLRMALGNAGVAVDGMGGGSGIAVTHDSLTIRVGRRRQIGMTS
jgi:hypothetical protein